MQRKIILIILFSASLVSCGKPQAIPPSQTPTRALIETATESPTSLPTLTSTPQPQLLPIEYGPDLEDFPTGVNPLTGQEVADPSLLNYPAVLVSISNMPVTARPQAGPAFAPWIFELYIGEGTTRFMGVFYGDDLREI